MVGDPLQLSPTIAGPGCLHQNGLERTLFDRLERFGIQPIMLRRQYRVSSRTFREYFSVRYSKMA